MNRRRIVIVVLGLLLTLPAAAGSLEKEMRARWLGAWIVTDVESYSDCAGRYTNNRVNGELVRGSGARSFEAGELAKVDRVDVKRSRLDLLLSVQEPVLIPYAAGPFTLYREAWCRIELEVTLPRQVVKGKDADWIDDALNRVVERYTNQNDAVTSGLWNERERDPFPEDYDDTLYEYAVWQVETTNNEVQSKLDHATEQALRLRDRLNGEVEYMQGFSTGVEEARLVAMESCRQRMSAAFRHTKLPHGAEVEDGRNVRGHDDGYNLIVALELMRGLPECFVPLPERADTQMAAAPHTK